jgi:phosphate starvation-inducible protein PhoH and related proteins
LTKHTHGDSHQVSITFSDNSVLSMLYGENDAHLAKIEKKLSLQASSRGNVVELTGERANVLVGMAALEALYADAKKGKEIGMQQVDAAIRMASAAPDENGRNLFGQADVVIKTMKKDVKPYSKVQAHYIESLYKHDLVFALR